MVNAEADWNKNQRNMENEIQAWHIILIVLITILISCACFYLLYLTCLWCFRLCGCADEEDEEEEIERVVNERLENRRTLRKRLDAKEEELIRKIKILEDKIRISQEEEKVLQKNTNESAA